jgi:HEAT repeat protein
LASTEDLLAVKALAAALREKDVPDRLRQRTAEIMKEIRCGGPLVDALRSHNPDLHSWALCAADHLPTPQRVEWLAEGFQSEEAAVREKAAQILGELRDDRAVEALLAAISDPEESVSRAVAEALARIGAARAVEPLIQTLQSPGKKGRPWAATALGDLRDRRAAAPLIAALRDADPRVRAHAARALPATADKEAIEPLAAIMGDSEASVRQAAIYALATIDDEQATEVVRSALNHHDLSTRTAATKAWKKKAGANSIVALVANLKNGDDELAYAAAEALESVLKQSGTAAAVQDLRAVERLEDMTLVESRATAESAGPVEIHCGHLKQLARAELIRRGAATGSGGGHSRSHY